MGGGGCELLFSAQGKENKFNKKILNKEEQKTKVNITTPLECCDSSLLFWICSRDPLVVTRCTSNVLFQMAPDGERGLPFPSCKLSRMQALTWVVGRPKTLIIKSVGTAVGLNSVVPRKRAGGFLDCTNHRTRLRLDWEEWVDGAWLSQNLGVAWEASCQFWYHLGKVAPLTCPSRTPTTGNMSIQKKKKKNCPWRRHNSVGVDIYTVF